MKCKIILEMDGMENEVDVRAATKIDPLMLDETLQEIAPNVAFYGSVATRLRCAMERQEWLLKKTKSRIALSLRQECSDKKVTQAHIEDMVETNEEVIKMQEKFFKMQEDYESVHAFLSALYVQKDAMIQLCANKRAEMKMAENG